MFAIAFHGFFEGIAVGLVSNLSTLIPLVIGVVIEEAVADFSFGVQLSKNLTRSKLSILTSITLLSFFQPVGTIIGLALTEAPRLVSSIVISFSGGTFLYIACSEIMMNEFKNQQHRYAKIVMFCVGFGVLVPLWLLHKH
jgi:solute carrier family 39 (zinc transporter), member 1/2/3